MYSRSSSNFTGILKELKKSYLSNYLSGLLASLETETVLFNQDSSPITIFLDGNDGLRRSISSPNLLVECPESPSKELKDARVYNRCNKFGVSCDEESIFCFRYFTFKKNYKSNQIGFSTQRTFDLDELSII